MLDEGAVRPDGAGGKLEMGHGAATVAGGIAAVDGAECAAAGRRGIDRLTGVLDAFFGRGREESEVGGLRRGGGGKIAPDGKL